MLWSIMILCIGHYDIVMSFQIKAYVKLLASTTCQPSSRDELTEHNHGFGLSQHGRLLFAIMEYHWNIDHVVSMLSPLHYIYKKDRRKSNPGSHNGYIRWMGKTRNVCQISNHESPTDSGQCLFQCTPTIPLNSACIPCIP